MAVPTSKELLDWIKPEPPIPEELQWAEEIKTGEYEIYAEKLNNICMEANEVFTRTGVTSMLRSGDCVVGIYTPAGDMVTAWCGTYLHAVVTQLTIKFIMRNWKDNPTVGIKEGDVFFANEALYGGIHNPDEIGAMPVFHKGELIAWAAAACHEPETGACDPGGVCQTAKSRYDEGMKITPMKIGENYQIRDDFLEMVANMCGRTPRPIITDIKARFSSADRIRLRLQQLAEEKGKEFLLGLFRKMLIHAEEGVRERIKSWNDGIYRSVLFHECPGTEKPYLIRLPLTLHKQGDRLIFDFSGTSPENYSSYHGFPHIVVAHAAVHLYSYPFYDLPISSGSLAHLDWIIPEGTMFNPDPTAAVSASVLIVPPVMIMCALCFSKMMFDSEQRLVASPFSGMGGGSPVVAGMNQWGAPIADLMAWFLNTQGQGARSDMDGMDAHGFFDCPTGKAPDAEDTENEFPIIVLMQKFLTNSGGFGKYQGGLGGSFVWATYHVPYTVNVGYSIGGTKLTVGQGLFGGYPPPTAPRLRIFDSNLLELMEKGDKNIPSSYHELVTKKTIAGKYDFGTPMLPPYLAKTGEIYGICSFGGNGYGDVLERDPEIVAKDLRSERITSWVAEKVYHVAYDPQTLKVDYARTKQLRQEERDRRLKRGKPYEEFEKEWLQKQPPQEILDFYGSWPNAEKVTPVFRP